MSEPIPLAKPIRPDRIDEVVAPARVTLRVEYPDGRDGWTVTWDQQPIRSEVSVSQEPERFYLQDPERSLQVEPRQIHVFDLEVRAEQYRVEVDR